MGQLPQIRLKFWSKPDLAKFPKKEPDAGFAGAEIRYIPRQNWI